MSLQKQPILQMQFIKQSVWLDIILSPDSTDIKFGNFERVDQKL